MALAFFYLSVTPSLLPRSILIQGVVSGIVTAAGYGIGVLGSWVVRRLLRRKRPAPPAMAWRVLAGFAAVLVPVSLVLGSGWQRDLHLLMGAQPPERYGYAGVPLLAAAVVLVAVGFARALRWASRMVTRGAAPWVPAPVARVVGVGVVLVLGVSLLNDVVIRSLADVADESFRRINAESRPDTAAPIEPNRSGSPDSLVAWASLGNQGRTFVTRGPTQEELAALFEGAAREPIRAYVGVDSAPTNAERAALAVQELERTDAFSREVLLVMTTTGTGWVDPQIAEPVEYMYGGDTAIVATQYSYLPSWLSFVVDLPRAREAGRVLFDAVYEVWSELPADDRPLLLVAGESLGSFGGESAFSGSADMANRTDGVLFVGPPNANQLWSEFTANREAGTPEVRPTYRDGETVRFATDPASLVGEEDGWSNPRVMYLQHASDPVTWWSPGLLLNRPDWLLEERGDDVLPSMQWYPLVTFWQVTADMIFSTKVPAGHGHNYGTEPTAAWAVIAPPDGWTPADTEELRDTLSQDD